MTGCELVSAVDVEGIEIPGAWNEFTDEIIGGEFNHGRFGNKIEIVLV